MGTSDSSAIEAVSSRTTHPTMKRQNRRLEFKRQIVEESFAPGASVARVARAHGMNANQVFNWRRLYRPGRLGTGSRPMPGLLAVRVAEPAAGMRIAETQRTTSGPAADRPGTMQIELPKGRLRVTGSVDLKALRIVIDELLPWNVAAPDADHRSDPG